jgi:hypothetical protein
MNVLRHCKSNLVAFKCFICLLDSTGNSTAI